MKLKQISLSKNIADSLLQGIREGKYTEKKPLPSLRKLACRYNTSITTVRSALQILQVNNKIFAYHGKGYFVKAKYSGKKQRLILILSRAGEMYEAMQEELLRLKSEYSGVYVVFETIDQRKEKLQESIEHMIANGLDTIFLNGVNVDKLDFLEAYQSFIDIYVFFHLSDSISHPGFAFGVFSDWYHGGYIGVRHLAECGCNKILALLSSSGCVQEDFKNGALSAAEETVSEVSVDFIYEYDAATGTKYDFNKLSEHLNNGTNGIFCFSHSIAFKVYDYLKSNNYRIPEDVAVLSYYDSNLSLEFSPPLSSISLRPEIISSELLKMYRGRNRQVVTVKPKLIKRASTLRTEKNSN